MSLPPDPPNTDAVLRPAAGHESFLVGSSTAGLVATGDVTDGRYGIFHWHLSGPASGATPHYHRTFSEAFYVLDGRIGLYDGTTWTDGTAGDFLYVPPSGIHAFRNDSGVPASMLILFAPAPPRERYFRELAERIASGIRYSDAERTEFMARHDQYEA